MHYGEEHHDREVGNTGGSVVAYVDRGLLRPGRRVPRNRDKGMSKRQRLRRAPLGDSRRGYKATVSEKKKNPLPGTSIAATHEICVGLQAEHWTDVRLVHIRLPGSREIGIGRCQERAGGLGCVVHNWVAGKGDQWTVRVWC